jgi:hypothetical protein
VKHPVVSEIPLLSCVSWLTALGGSKGSRAVRGPHGSRGLALSLASVKWCRPVALVVAAADRDPSAGPRQAGSLTGAVHLSNSNAGVPRPAQRGQKPRVEQKGKSWPAPAFQ